MSPRDATQMIQGEPVYTIGELAKTFQVSLRTLRFYESRGLLKSHRHGKKRSYGPKDVDRLTAIVRAKKFGFTLNEIRQMTDGSGEAEQGFQLTGENCREKIGLLEGKLEEITHALTELRQLYASLWPDPQTNPCSDGVASRQG